ncbi:MAG: hypothetical protein ACREE0_11740 [Phenylobacterium sp.]
MTPTAALALGLLLQASAASTPSADAFVLKCDMTGTRAGWGNAEVWRTFRLAPNSFQEWKADEGKFGPNLCSSYACSADKNRLQGTIGSATLIVTVELSSDRRKATWSATGASGLSRSNGVCLIQPHVSAIKPE